MGLLKGIDKNLVELEVKLLAETAAAIQISDGIVNPWIPKSLLEDDLEHLDNGLVRIVIPEWIAKEKLLI